MSGQQGEITLDSGVELAVKYVPVCHKMDRNEEITPSKSSKQSGFLFFFLLLYYR